MRSLFAATLVSFALAAPADAAPALATDVADASAPSPLRTQSSPSATTTRAVSMHYPTLEKMLRRFSREAGAARTRG